MPPVVLEIVVHADKGIAELRQLDKTLHDTTKATQQHTQAQAQATQTNNSFAASLGQSVKSAAGLAAGFAGVAGIATTLTAAATAATGFEAALNAINALGTISTQQLSRLREQVLGLSPALGSSTELAKGLYDILGANVPAENAITVLASAAELAKGGLGSLDTAINAVTKSAAAFGIPLSEAQYVTDVFTQTVVKGQGRLEEFANAFPQVAATAAATGASFVDTNAAMAVLTQTFKNADTAATGLNSFFQQLIQNSAKFAAEGINVKQVLAEEGLTGVFRRLQEVTGGSAERMKELINDSEGFRAALTLTGTQFETFNETVASYANVTGLAQQAASKNLAGSTASWQTLLNTLDRLVQEIAPPLLEMFTSITRVATTLAADVTKLWRAFAQSETLRQLTADFQQFFQLIGQSDAFTTLNANLLSTSGSTTDAYNAFDALAALLEGNVRPAIDFVTAGWDLLNAGFDYIVAATLKLGQYLVDYVVHPLFLVMDAADRAMTAMGLQAETTNKYADASAALSKELQVAVNAFQEQAEEFVLGTNRMNTAQASANKTLQTTTSAVTTQAGALPKLGQATAAASTQTTQLSEEQKKLNKALEAANNAASGLKGALDKLQMGDIAKAISTEELSKAVATVITHLKEMEEGGKFSARQISQAYDDAAEVLRARFGTLPADFQAAFDAMRERASTTADGIALAFERLGIKTHEVLQKAAAQSLADFQTVLEEWNKTANASPKALLEAWEDVTRQISEAGFKQLPENFHAMNTRMVDIARRAGQEIARPYVDAFGQIIIAGERAGQRLSKAAHDIDTSWLQTRGALERAKGAVQELAAESVKLSDQTKKLMDTQISVETKFATDIKGLLTQLLTARNELFNIQNNVISTAGGAPGERDYRIAQHLKIIEAIVAALAKLGVDDLGRPLPKPKEPVRRQHGGSVWGGEPYLVGERGPELFVPRTSGTVLPAAQTSRRMGMEAPVTYNLVIHTQAQDAAALARDLVPYLRQADLSKRPVTG